MVLPHNAHCASWRGMRSLTRTNRVGCRNPSAAKVKLVFISTSIGSLRLILADTDDGDIEDVSVFEMLHLY
jgi:hypothetical protein